MPDQAVLVWVESGAGRIARGHTDCVTAEGLTVRLAEAPDFGPGEEVAVRICFDRGAPIVAATACVVGLRAGGDAAECDLRWTATANEWAAFDA